MIVKWIEKKIMKEKKNHITIITIIMNIDITIINPKIKAGIEVEVELEVEIEVEVEVEQPVNRDIKILYIKIAL